MESPRIQKLLSPQGWMSPLVFIDTTILKCRLQCQWRNEIVRKVRTSWKKAKASFFPSMSVYQLPAGGVVQTNGVSSWLKMWIKAGCLPAWSRLKACLLPAQKIFLPPRSRLEVIFLLQFKQKFLTSEPSGYRLLLIPDVVKLTAHSSPQS